MNKLKDKPSQKGIYLSPEAVELIKKFLIETSKIIREASERIERENPKLFPKKAEDGD